MRFTCIACSLQDYVQLHMCIILCLTSEILSFIINTKKKNKLINQFVLSPMLTAIMYVSTGTLDIERILNVSIQYAALHALYIDMYITHIHDHH